jgi:hypothetical protein
MRARRNRYQKLLNSLESKTQSSPVATEPQLPLRIDWEAANQAGLFTIEDVQDLEQRFQAAIRRSKAGESKPKQIRQETLASTTEYHQKPGNSSLTGGRK